MNRSSNHRSSSRASSVSSESSTPVSRRKKAGRALNTTFRNSSTTSSMSSVHALRRLKSKAKNVSWSNTTDNSTNDDTTGLHESINPQDQQQQHQTTDDHESPMIIDQNDPDMTPSAMISSLSLSRSKNINNQAATTTNCNSPVVSDTEDNAHSTRDDIGTSPLHSQTNQDATTNLDILSFFDESDRGDVYKCKLCQSDIRKQKRSTANLRRHIGSVHGESAFMFKSQLKEQSNKRSSVSSEFKKKLDEKQINAIIIDSRSFGDFSRDGMREFLATAVPGYHPLHRTTVRKRLHKLYIEHRQILRTVLSDVSDLALTTDIWKDSRNRHFIAITGHFYDKQFKLISLCLGFRLIEGRHIATRLSKFIKHEIISLNIEEKVRCITADNAGNVINAILQLGIGVRHSCMAHNLHLVVKSTILPFRKKKSTSSSRPSNAADVYLTTEEPSSDDNASTSEYSTSEEETSDEDEPSSTSKTNPSSSENTSFVSSDDELSNDSTSTTVSNDPTLVLIRSLIKRVRELVGVVHKSAPLCEYIRQQAKERKLSGEGLIIDCDIRWNSCYLMLARFIDYRSIVENITIHPRSIALDLSPATVSHLRKLMFTDTDWDYLTATCNVLDVVNHACHLLSRKRYQSLSIAYVVSRGLSNLLSVLSTGSLATIENVIKKYLLESFVQHFDKKLSVEQKEATLMTAYLDPYTFHRMDEGDRNLARKLVLTELNSNHSTGQSPNAYASNPSRSKTNDPLDLFLMKCGIETSSATTVTTPSQSRSADEELRLYCAKVQNYESFEQFWNDHQYDLPRMAALIRRYNVRTATSVASESLFSTAAYVQRKQRSSLAPDTLRYSMVLRDRNILKTLV